MFWHRLDLAKLTPFARAQIGWALLLLAFFAMLELAKDLNLALFYFLLIIGYFRSKYHPVHKFSQPYWIIEVMLGLGAVYIYVRFIWSA